MGLADERRTVTPVRSEESILGIRIASSNIGCISVSFSAVMTFIWWWVVVASPENSSKLKFLVSGMNLP